MLRPNQFARTVLRAVGYDLLRNKHSPAVNLLGLRNYPIRSIVDLGANRGQFARQMREEFPDAHVYCFEPLPSAYAELSAWARSQNGAVSTHNVAVGDVPGSIEMFHHVDFSQSSSILPTTAREVELFEITRRQEKIDVEVMTLDQVAGTLDPPLQPDVLIKADVQGYEDRVIAGGTRTLRLARACLLEASLEPLYEGQARFDVLVARLYDLGFQYAGNLVQYCGDDGHVVFVDSLFLRR